MFLRGAVAAGALSCALLVTACGEMPAPRLLLLISVDTLRADELGVYGSEQGLTPHIDAFAGEGIVFTSAYAPASFTLPSVAALLTGRYPEELGIRTNESGLPATVSTLATELSGRGWRGGAVVGNFVLRRESGLARGFALFDDEFGQHEAVRRWPERVATDTTDALLAMLDDCTALPSANCFLWVHYQDPHGPYDPPGDRRERLLAAERRAPDGATELPAGDDHFGYASIPSYQYMDGRYEVAWYRAGYRAEIQYMDEEVGRLLAALEARRLASRAVVVFAADHGESLGEHGVWFAHGARLTDEQVRVPLILRVPGRQPARRNDPVSLVDVYPTLLALLEDVPPDEGRLGRNLLGRDAEGSASRPYMATLGAGDVERYALIEDGFKFIMSQRAGVYDARLHRLGQEDVDLTPGAPQVAARMRRALDALRGQLDRGVGETRQDLSDADRDRLRALGYVEEPGSTPSPGVTRPRR
jgi:arylsulfatase